MASVEALDAEIASVREQITQLRARRANLSSILLATPQLSTRLQQRPVQHERLRRNASKVVKKQSDRNVENVYRACAGVTAYKVKDPDPNAVDGGNILGVRIEVFVDGKFIDTYNVLFNRPSQRHKTMLKIHRHTIPPCIPVKQLANKFLPQSQREASKTTEQNLIKFGKVLRKELVSWHMRTAAVEKLLAEAGLADKTTKERLEGNEPAYGKVLNAFVSDDEDEESEDDDFIDNGDRRRRHRDGPVKITEFEADMAVRRIDVLWSNGQAAVVEVAKDGEIVKGVVRNGDGKRMSRLERKTIGRMEGLVQRLTA
jgi:central kinetochore subunit Mal2/MCM21